MKTMKNVLVIAVVLFAVVSCVTQTQVKEIVATSNAAMVDVPDLPQADSGVVDEAKLMAAIERIETIIATHPNQPVLINTLRMRQAMMLTVANKPRAAKMVWIQVAKPPGQRDAALYTLQEELVWWFGVAKNFKDEDVETGMGYLGKIETVCNVLPKRSNIRDYLETMRAAIGLTIANKTSTMHNDTGKRKLKKKEVADQMVAYLKRFAEQFDESDQVWIKSNWTATEAFPDIPVSVVRARVELRRLMMEYFKRTKVKKLEEFEVVMWQPGWVDAQWQVWKETN
ncbi:hypothetical protein C6A37_04495 [Desulfobacteraceae bacterium SEEP-SAG9]|nr:hypothetical protein C6A37_04495 [Desulfobacteraceae bacterium SEEP-SAG9]